MSNANVDEFDARNVENELSAEVLELAAILEGDAEFEAKLDQILSTMQESSLNLSLVQSEIILLIESVFERLIVSKEDLEKAKTSYNQKKEIIAKNLKELSTYLMMHRSSLISKTIFGIEGPEDKNLFITSEIQAHLKRILRRFAIYEIYKIMTPKRIAGKTKRQNFVANAVLRGMKVAMQHEGGSAQEIKSYGKNILKEIKGYKRALGSRGLNNIGRSLGKNSEKM
jgi:hypothetical protein